VRGDEHDPSQPRGGGLSNMGQFSYGELKCVRDDPDAGATSSEENGDGSIDEDEWEEADERSAAADVADAADAAASAEEEEEDEDTAEVDNEERRAAQRADEAGYACASDSEIDGDDDDNGDGDCGSDDSGAAKPLAATRGAVGMRGAHPLFEAPSPDMRPTLSPFLMVRACCLLSSAPFCNAVVR
jgi:hypothetical protein